MSPSLKISSSKSLVNRYLILKEGHPSLDMTWFSEAEDVQNLKSVLASAPNSNEYNIGEGGTTLRFFAAYLSTFKGEWVLTCRESLLQRPQAELTTALKALGADLIQLNSTTLILKSKGWRVEEISIDMKDSTQILTGLSLAALSRGLPLKVNLKEIGTNSDYFEMTKAFVKNLGFELIQSDGALTIPGSQTAAPVELGAIESDWSSAAFLMILGALRGSICIEGLTEQSLQPDSVITALLNKIGAKIEKVGRVDIGALPYSAFDFDVQKSPDLFPVLCVLACFCEGDSRIYGAPQLKNKESNRISRMNDLLSLCGYQITVLKDGALVKGKGLKVINASVIEFDVSKDHRLYMATELLNAMGYQIKALGSASILKSFAEYEEIKKESLACFF
jgi:3-phosphoshikimate 1-carboxyvinyltransferase